MQIFCVTVWPQAEAAQPESSRYIQTAVQLGVQSLSGCVTARLFFLHGQFNLHEAERLAQELLCDPVTENYTVTKGHSSTPFQSTHSIEVTLLPGVTDTAAENLLRTAHLLDIEGLSAAATGHHYALFGRLTAPELQTLATRLFSNPVIQRCEINRPIAPPFVSEQAGAGSVESIPLCDATTERLLAISTERRLSLDLAEMRAIQAYYIREEREPTDVELEMLAQTWSEHCVHKTFKAAIDYTGPLPGRGDFAPARQKINGLLKTYIRAATEQLNRPWVRSAFVDNAGIIAFDEQWDLAFKVETHNHPSALEPFGGANTGVGGVIRDILGVSARPIATTDVLCFGPQDLTQERLPEGVLHPRRIADGVIHGIEDYGNKMGIPTVNGAICYHPGYTANPLVFCGCLGLLPHGAHPTEAQPGDLIVVLGGRTGRDGIRGATFSSMEMDSSTGEHAGSSVQIGHPIHEKQVLEAVLTARDEGLYHAITDCGAGGLSSAVGEMGRSTGAHVQLETVPLKYPGLLPWEIWLSEAQERMVMAVPPQHWERLQYICHIHDVEAVCIGSFEDMGRLELYYEDQQVGSLDMEFLHNGIPTRQLTAVWQPPQYTAPTEPARMEPAEMLLKLLAHPDIRSKEDVVRRYDHEVQGGTVIKPLVGVDNHGPGDATVLVPLDTVSAAQPDIQPPGLALAVGICPQYAEHDPYIMAWAALDEALRNLVCVGADPDRVAVLDNFCWGNPGLPDRLGALVRCAQGCYDVALAYGTPFISGKDSLNNEYLGEDGQRHAIPGTLLISALGIVPEIGRTATMDLKTPGNFLYLIGETRDEMAGSHHHLLLGRSDGNLPAPVPDALNTLRALHRAIREGLVRACHDCSEGGAGVALAEMCIAGRTGAEVDTGLMAADTELDLTTCLFAQSLTRFIVEVRPEDAAAFERLLAGLPCYRVGQVLDSSGPLRVRRGTETVISVSVAELETAWRGVPPAAVPARRAAESPAFTAPVVHSDRPRVAILHAAGTNRDREAALACERAGGRPEIVYMNEVIAREKDLLDYHMLVLPGGFSYGDDLGAGVLWAAELRHRLQDVMGRFIEDGRPVLGICNGFQVLVKAGFLPGVSFGRSARPATLTYNTSGRFECRWVYLEAASHSQSPFIKGTETLIHCPVAHGEGRFMTADADIEKLLRTQELITLRYISDGAGEVNYPANPNGSYSDIAGICNPAGNVMGLMPHPEDHIFPWQHPGWHRGETGMTGLILFRNGLKYAQEL